MWRFIFSFLVWNDSIKAASLGFLLLLKEFHVYLEKEMRPRNQYLVEEIILKLVDISIGPDWIIWAAFVILLVISVILLSGHGSWFISGYNTALKEEKEKYDEKKLCRTMGFGMAVIAILILVMGLFEEVLPASFAYISIGVVGVDCLVIIIVSHTICKKE